MGLTVIIEENKIEEASHFAEKMLHYGGRLMSCLEGMRRGQESMNHRMIDYNQPRDHHPDPFSMEKVWQHPHVMQERTHYINERQGEGYNNKGYMGNYGTHNYGEWYNQRDFDGMYEGREMPGTRPMYRRYNG